MIGAAILAAHPPACFYRMGFQRLGYEFTGLHQHAIDMSVFSDGLLVIPALRLPVK